MNVGELRAIINDSDIPDELPVRLQVSDRTGIWEYELDGAHGQLAGKFPYLTLELAAGKSVDVDG